MRLARGIPLAGLLALSACSSSVPRETPPDSLKDAGATSGAAKSSSAASGANSPDAVDSRKPSSTVHAEEKNGAAGGSIYFSDGDAALSEESIKVLRQQAEYLKQNPKRLIVLRAYLDSLGSRTFSLAIVQKRLNVVATTLREQGVAKSRIRQVMLGQRSKKQSCESPSCQNRGQRIELLYK
ncbi:MAG: hypothetical protein H6R13_465 [Proteobacteria bacterium]|nr:hypothetical protein [Pseudomonadota bacterium]